ncbi:MAG: FtsX-like permease family protein [Firmicutes bacterium ADurb.Bin248]|nr:MAG: FtsX-like permease family protein [Firmicutes bacterium ADurb.Bin248]
MPGAAPEDDAQDRLLTGISRLAAAPLLAPEQGVEIEWLESWDETLFQSGASACLLPEGMLGLAKEGVLELIATLEDSADIGEPVEVPVGLTVAGTYAGASKTVYMPWAAMGALLAQAGFMEYTQSMSFTVADNLELDALKREAARFFASASLSPGETPFQYALTVYDGILAESTGAVKKDIRLLEALIPLILALSALVGFAASFLFIRARQMEFAVMLLLGSGRAQVFLTAFIEQLALELFGALLGMLAYLALRGLGPFPAPGAPGIYLACHTAGMAAATLWLTRANVMLLLKAKE